MAVTVFPRLGTTYPDALGEPITADGAIVDESQYINDAIAAGYLLTTDPLGVFQPADRTGTTSGGAPVAASYVVISATSGLSDEHVLSGIGGTVVTPGVGTVVVSSPALSDATPAPVGTASAGNTAEMSRSNHVHAHGNQLGGSLHAVATTLAAGFMSAADKALLASLAAGGTTAVSTAADLTALIGAVNGMACELLGYYAPGDGGGGTFYWSAGDSTTADGGTVFGAGSGRWHRVYSGAINVKWFGAKGDNTQTLQAVTSYSGFPWTITQQTADGEAINRAIDAVHTAGGGELFIPAGTYRVWGYLKVIGHQPVGGGASYNFRDVAIRGEGIGATVLKSCDTSPVNAHGYGIFQVGVGNAGSHPALIPNSRVTNFLLSDLTLDGNAVTRNITSGEWWSDNLVFVGWPNAVVERVESINGVRDCVLVNFESYGLDSTPPTIDNGVPAGVRLVNCNLATSWRNTLTIAAGRDVRVTGCRITGGGRVGAGTLPRSCMDIEPDGANYPVRDVVVTDTLFEDAPGQLTNVVWSSVRFVNCTFSMIGPFPAGLHWPMIAVSSQVDLIGCTFRDTAVRTGYLWYYPTYGTGEFIKDEYMQVKDCSFDGCGFLAQGCNTVIDGCDFSNSLFPVLIQDSSASMRRVSVRDLNLVNVVDAANQGSGPMAAFALHQSVTCPIFVDGVSSVFDPTRAPAGVDFTTDNGAALVVAHGVCIDPLPAITSEVKISNVHSAGWYRKYTTYTTTTPSGFCSDWGGGGGGDLGPAPANTAGTQTAPGTVRYANCTYYGDLA